MSRKSSKRKTSSETPVIVWHDEEQPSPRKKKKSKPTPSQRLSTMSELVLHLGQSAEDVTTADIERLQILARGQDINIEFLEI